MAEEEQEQKGVGHRYFFSILQFIWTDERRSIAYLNVPYLYLYHISTVTEFCEILNNGSENANIPIIYELYSPCWLIESWASVLWEEKTPYTPFKTHVSPAIVERWSVYFRIQVTRHAFTVKMNAIQSGALLGAERHSPAGTGTKHSSRSMKLHA